MNRRSPSVLLVEDNEDLALGLHNNLEIEGYQVVTVHSGEAALEYLQEATPDIVILDLMLPGLSGMKVLLESRKAQYQGPVLVLTARGEEADKVRALRLGADDYVTKPFGLLELLARVEALLRRGSLAPKAAEPLYHGDLELRPAQRQVLRRGKEVDLTPKEYDLLLALLEAQGSVVSRSDLLQKVWGYQVGIITRTVDTHIAELRRKIEDDPSRPSVILTVRKAGYRMAELHPADD